MKKKVQTTKKMTKTMVIEVNKKIYTLKPKVVNPKVTNKKELEELIAEEITRKNPLAMKGAYNSFKVSYRNELYSLEDDVRKNRPYIELVEKLMNTEQTKLSQAKREVAQKIDSQEANHDEHSDEYIAELKAKLEELRKVKVSKEALDEHIALSKKFTKTHATISNKSYLILNELGFDRDAKGLVQAKKAMDDFDYFMKYAELEYPNRYTFSAMDNIELVTSLLESDFEINETRYLMF